MSREDAWRTKAISKDGVVTGRRMWSLARDRERWRLTNIAHVTHEYWPRGVYEADCRNWNTHADRTPSPHPSCHCGLYAFWNMSELEAQWHTGLVSGIVHAWGRILPGNQGFLAQYMTPVAIDWPKCVSINTCTNPATQGFISPEWQEDYPSQWADPEGYKDAWEWVNLRTSSIRFLCEEHMGPTGTNISSKDGFWVPVSDIMTNLENYYELEILPGVDFGTEWDNIGNDFRPPKKP